MSEQFEHNVEDVTATLSEIFREQGKTAVANLLESAEASILPTGYDNLDGGTDIFTLFLDIPPKEFARIEPQVDALQKEIGRKLKTSIHCRENQWLHTVLIRPIMVKPSKAGVKKLVSGDLRSIWEPGFLRVFISHKASFKKEAATLAGALKERGVSCFVAHDAITPTKEWLAEIEKALFSMEVLVALMTEDFHDSKWTDQEVGVAMGRKVPVIPVSVEIDPYGFIGKYQAVNGRSKDMPELARVLLSLFGEKEETKARVLEGMVRRFETARDYGEANYVMRLLASMDSLPPPFIERIEKAPVSNDQLCNFVVSRMLPGALRRWKIAAGLPLTEADN